MRATTKIFILLAAMLIIAGTFLFYSKTKVEPPLSIQIENQYMEALKKAQENLTSANESNAKEVDSRFLSVVEKVNAFHRDMKVDDAFYNKFIVDITANYVPIFKRRCYKAFNHHVWSIDDHAYILSRIDGLKSLKKTNSTDALSHKGLQDLNDISQIIYDYRRARTVSRQTRFTNLQNARSTIGNADSYIAHEYLSNCTDLVEDLRSVRGKLEQSYYTYVMSEVELLANYRYVSEGFYNNTLLPSVSRTIDEYNNELSTLFRSNRPTDPIYNKARAYRAQALNYYKVQRY